MFIPEPFYKERIAMEMLEKFKKCIKQYGTLYTCGGDHRKANKAYKEAIHCLTILMKTDFGRAGIYALLEDDDEIIKRYTASLVIHDYPEKLFCAPYA